MPSSRFPSETRFFRFASICFLVAGLFHLMGYCFPQPDDHQSPLRHFSFVLIDFGFAILFLLRPRWLIYPYGAFLVEQYYQHGNQIRIHFLEHGRLSLLDTLVLVVLTGIMIFLLRIRLREKLHAEEQVPQSR